MDISQQGAFSSANARLERLLHTATFPPTQIESKLQAIREVVLRESSSIHSGMFDSIHTNDLRLLFRSYDELFFNRALSDALDGCPIYFRLSNRMTRAGGKTIARYTSRERSVAKEYEIAISTFLLFSSFRGVEREIKVVGLACQDRLQALQRVFEHELVHLAELLAFRDSSCQRARFQGIAKRCFGHACHRHELVTQNEVAHAQFGITRGSRVRFRHEGTLYRGLVNRITKRATVLVEDPAGVRYSDGKHYVKFYVPLAALEPDLRHNED